MTAAAPTRNTRLCAAALCAVCGLTAAAHSASLTLQPAPAAAAAQFTGRDFAGLRLSTAVLPVSLDLAATRVWAWQDGATRRLHLDRDVLVTLGDRRFHAAEAVVWIETIPGGTPDRPRRQGAFYFSDLRDPTAAPELATRAKRLLVTVVFEGDVTLRSDRFTPARPDAPLLGEAETRMARFVHDSFFPPPAAPPAPARGPIPLRASEGGDLPDTPSPTRPAPTRPADPSAPGYVPDDRIPPAPPPTSTDLTAAPVPAPPEDPTLGPAQRTEPIVPAEGVVTFFGPQRSLVTGPEENALVITGGAAVSFVDASQGRNLQLTAQRAVVYLDPGAVSDALEAGVGSVRGVYLEGAVSATDGQYTLRGEKLYYDFQTNRAVVLDAVFWTYDQQRAMPLYVRAGAIRQESENQWNGEGVKLSNSSFFEPHLSIGADSVTITRRRDEAGAGPDRFTVDARGGAVNAGGLPVLPLPRYRGDLSNPPLRSASIGSRDGQPVVRTTWDALTLFGLEQAEGFDPTILLDAHFGRGPAFGTDTRWATPDSEGLLFGYYIYDEGTDDLSSGAEIDRDGESRGMVAFEHRWRFADPWTLFLEGSYISDPAFVDAFFESMAETRREFTNSAYLRRLDERSMFSLEVRGSLHDFTPNEYLLQSQGYTVDRLPDARYSRVADTFFDGLVNWSSDSSIARVAMNFTEPDVREFGFDTPARSMAAFGLQPGESLADRLRAQGLNEDYVPPPDTRHEIPAPLKFAP
ncbi:MAG: LPS assembly protein LptD, partial [Phycisphaerales bacterium]|nr:LPS assembly protein LptD [Phycisphaerales bacterium]